MHRLLLSLFFVTLATHAHAASLAPAGKGGNPSFQIGVGFDKPGAPATIEWSCQATLVAHRKEGKQWVCSMVTAAHCVQADSGKHTGQTFFTADFGKLRQPQVVVKPGIAIGAEDIAVVHFECAESARNLLVPIADPPSKPTDAMGLPVMTYAASAAFSTLFSATLPSNYSPEKGTIDMQLGAGEINGVRQTYATYSGDSGGGLFIREKKSGELMLIGVTSAGIHMLDKPLAGDEGIPHEKGSDMTVFASDVSWIRAQLSQ